MAHLQYATFIESYCLAAIYFREMSLIEILYFQGLFGILATGE